MLPTLESRDAIARAKFFLERANSCRPEERVECEAFMEASIIFARTAMHRFQAKNKKHPKWKTWWDSLLQEPSVEFIRTERDFILKKAPPKVGQKIFMPSISLAGDTIPPSIVGRACDFYYYEYPGTPATATIAKHLETLEKMLEHAEKQLS